MNTKNLFTTKKIAGTAVLVALAYSVSFLEFAVFPSASFLKLDFSGVFLLLAGFMYGPLYAFIAIIVKELLRFLTSSTGGIGEIVNAIVYLAYVMLPATLYTFKKGFKFVIIYLVFAIILQLLAAMFTNRFITFPMYFGEKGGAIFKEYFVYLFFFNLIKSVSLSVLTVLLYKRVKFLFKKASTSIKKQKESGEFISKSVEDTERFAKDYAKTLSKGDVLILSGEMGAGKTAFVKGLAKGLCIEDEVLSPTYAYLNVYGDLLYHYDFYRLSSGDDAERLGLTDYLGKDNICVLEWAENVESAIKVACKKIIIQKLGDKKRKITVL